jgi:hypothetical protein
MPAPTRQRVAPTDDWQQLQFLVNWPEQLAYELIRPIVLFGLTPAERAAQTGTSERSLRRRGQHFDGTGMASLFADAALFGEMIVAFSPHLRQLIVDLKAEYPAFGLRGSLRSAMCHLEDGPVPPRFGTSSPMDPSPDQPGTASTTLMRSPGNVSLNMKMLAVLRVP